MNALAEFLREPVIERLGWTLVHSVWQCAAIGVLLAIALIFLRTSQWRYRAAYGALVLCLLAPVMTYAWLSQDQAALPLSSLPAPVLAADISARPMTAMILPEPIATEPSWRAAVPAAAVVWLAGVMFLWARHALGWMSLRRLRHTARPIADSGLLERLSRLSAQLGIRRPIALRESARVAVPSLIGWLRPMILLPIGALAGLSAPQLDAILAHELAHVRRNDYLANLLQTLIETLLFYHPAVWWISKIIRQEREHACDDMAVGVIGSAREYGLALAAMEQMRGPGAMAMAASGGSLLKRIRRLARPEPRRSMLWPALIVVAVVLGVAACSRVVMQEAKAQEPTTQPVAQPAFDPAPYVNASNDELMKLTPEQRRAVAAERMRQREQWTAPSTRPGRSQGPNPAELDMLRVEIQGLSEAYTAAQIKRIQSEGTLSADHPTVKQARDKEAALQARLREKMDQMHALNAQLGQAQQSAALASAWAIQGAAGDKTDLIEAKQGELAQLRDRLQQRLDELKLAGAPADNPQAVETLRSNLARTNQELQLLTVELAKAREEEALRELQAPSPTYYISGVSSSGMYTMNGRVTLNDALNRANANQSIDHGKYVAVIHQHHVDGQKSHVLASHDLQTTGGNFVIRNGDVIMVTDQGTLPLPPEQRYSVQGKVNKPGHYPLQRNMTLLQAVVATGVNPPDVPQWKVLWYRNGQAMPSKDANLFGGVNYHGIPMADLIGGAIGMEKIVAGDTIEIAEPDPAPQP